MGTGSDADASGGGGVAAGNKANGVGGVRGIDVGNVASGGVAVGKVSFVPKTNSSIAAKWFAFLGTHVNAPMISLNSRLYSLPEYEAG